MPNTEQRMMKTVILTFMVLCWGAVANAGTKHNIDSLLGVGVAMTDEMHRRDFRLMKDMGANFIRISHHPQDDALLEMCDRMGMLAWEEIPVIDIVPDTPGYGDNCERSL